MAANQSMKDCLPSTRDHPALMRSPVHTSDKQNRLSSYLRKSQIPEHRPVERDSSFHLAPTDVDTAFAIQIRESMRGEECLDSLCCRYRSEEHTSELQSLMRISYAVFCLKKQNKDKQ